MSVGRTLLKRFGIDMRAGEGALAWLFFLGFFLIITFQYTAKTVRQSSFISELGAEYLPVVFLLVAFCSYPVLRLYSRYADRIQTHRLLIISCLIIAASMILFWWAFGLDPQPTIAGRAIVPVLFYVWVSVIFVMTVSQFWTYANNIFDPRQAKRLFGFLGAGGLLGGIMGGQVARIATQIVDTRFALIVAAVILSGVILIMALVHRMRPQEEEPAAAATNSSGKLDKMDAAKGGLETIKSSRHLTLIAGVMILTVMVAQVVDVQFNWAVSRSISGKDAMTAFYGNFFTFMGIAAFLFQLIFTARIHRALGVGFAMRVLPVSMAFGTIGVFVAAAAFPGALLAMAIVLKVSESGLRYSLDQATRELLFLPVPAQARLKAKAFIDVFVQRGAKGLAAVLLLPITFGLMQPQEAGWITLGLIVVWMIVIGMMAREYVKSFRQGLKQRTVDTAVPINVSDVTTLELLVESLGSSDSRQVLHSINLLASNERGNLVPPLLLYHDDAEIRQRTLELLREIGRSDAAALIERRLGDVDPDVRAEAIQTLASLEGQNIVDLMLPRLTDPEPGVRAAAVACLVNDGEEEQVGEAKSVLLDLLSDADIEARVEAAKALGAIREPELQEQLIRLLYDREPEVVRETIQAIRRRVARDGFNPIYVPTLISLLHDRHLKQDAREALVAFGEPVIPTLVHFMGDTDEPIWVRRALPKSVARIGTDQAATALIGSLERFKDRFLRRKVIEALPGVGSEDLVTEQREAIESAIRFEIQQYFAALVRLSIVGIEEKGDLNGPEVDWSSGTHEPGLLEKLLAERMVEHLHNVFGLLAVLYPPKDIWAAYRSLLSGQPAVRNNALEYLDNTLSVSLKQQVNPMLDNQPLSEKVNHAETLIGEERPSKGELLTRLLDAEDSGETEECGLKVSAMYHIYAEGMSDLYAAVRSIQETSSDPFVTETAEWVSRRVA